MNLEAALLEIGNWLGLDGAELIRFAEEDDIGGFDFDASKAAFPSGSIWSVEGRVIYALVRAIMPAWSLELGTWHGASTTHILSALKANRYGELTSVDWWEGAGKLVPPELHDNWYMLYMEATEFLSKPMRAYDFVFEDCIHSESEVYAIVTALKPKLRPGAVVAHHDSEHGDDGQQIQRALYRAGVDFRSWLIEPSDCGVAIWRAE